MTLIEMKMIKVKLKELKKWRREVCDAFERWPMFYTSKWFIDQMKMFDKRIQKYESQLRK